MSISPSEAADRDRTGVLRLRFGAWLGLLAAFIAVVLPSAAILVTAYNPGGFFSFAPGLLQTSALLVLAGAVLYILSLFLYRRSFAVLRKVNRDFSTASFLCLLGSVGFILILVSAAVITGSASSLLGCVKGQPSHALSCLEANEPLGAYTALVGFVLAWLGGLGVVLGLWVGGSHFDARALGVGAIVYLFFLFLLLAPLIELSFAFPDSQYLLLVVPAFSILAPTLVLVGARTKRATGGTPSSRVPASTP